jgi:hypothetical protein
MTDTRKRFDAKPSSGNGSGSFAGFAAELLTTPECRQAVGQVVSEVVAGWASESTLRKTVARPVTWAVSRGASPHGDSSDNGGLAKIFGDPRHGQVIVKHLPAMAGGMVSVLHAMVRHLETLPPEGKGKFFDDILSQVNSGKMGEVFTSLARTAGELQRSDPTFFSKRVLSLLRSFLETADFGEFRELLDHSREDLAALATGVNELAFDYPAKLVLLLSAIPDASNFLLVFTEDLLKRFADLPPDVLSDILLTFFKEIDGITLGRLVDRVTEIIRLVHTGSSLIGDAGTPQFTADLREKLRVAAAEIDPALLFKASNALIDGREAVLKTACDVAGENPELLKLRLKHLSAQKNSNIRLMKHRLESLEALPEEEVAQALADGLSGWNGYDLAETMNLAAQTANTLKATNPDVVEQVLGEFFGSLDLQDVEETVAWLAADIGRAARPLVRVAAPILIKEVLGCLTPEDDGNDEPIAEALTMLCRTITGKEAR